MEPLQIGLIVIACCILVLSLIGNIALSVAVFRQLPHQAVKNYSYLILNLAVSDLLLAVSSIPFDIVQRVHYPVFPFGATMCKMLWPFQTVCSMASIFTVGALSYQRYRFIVKPCKGTLPLKLFLAMVTSIWILPVLLAGIPYSFVLHMDRNRSSCDENWVPVTKKAEMKLSFTAYLFIIQYVIPLGLIVWCNVTAIKRLKRYLTYRRRTSMLCAHPIENHENAVKMLITIMTVFALFWLPGQVIAFLLEFSPDNEFILIYGKEIGYLFAFANCVANPVIFAFFSKGHCVTLPFFRRLKSTDTGDPYSICEMGTAESSTKRASYSRRLSQTNGDVDSGNRMMRNFLQVLKTMKEDRLRKLLDSTPETTLN